MRVDVDLRVAGKGEPADVELLDEAGVDCPIGALVMPPEALDGSAAGSSCAGEVSKPLPAAPVGCPTSSGVKPESVAALSGGSAVESSEPDGIAVMAISVKGENRIDRTSQNAHPASTTSSTRKIATSTPADMPFR